MTVGGRNGTGETQKNTTEMNKTAYCTQKLMRNGFGAHYMLWSSWFASSVLGLFLTEIWYDGPDDVPLDVGLRVIGPGLGCGREGMPFLDTLRERTNRMSRRPLLLLLLAHSPNHTIFCISMKLAPHLSVQLLLLFEQVWWFWLHSLWVVILIWQQTVN